MYASTWFALIALLFGALNVSSTQTEDETFELHVSNLTYIEASQTTPAILGTQTPDDESLSRVCQESNETDDSNCIQKGDSKEPLSDFHRNQTEMSTVDETDSPEPIPTNDLLKEVDFPATEITLDERTTLNTRQASSDPTVNVNDAGYSNLYLMNQSYSNEHLAGTLESNSIDESTTQANDSTDNPSVYIPTDFPIPEEQDQTKEIENAFTKNNEELSTQSLFIDGAARNSVINTTETASQTEPTIEVFQAEQLFNFDQVINSSSGILKTLDPEEIKPQERSFESTVVDDSDESDIHSGKASDACYQRPIIQPCLEDVFNVNTSASTWYYDPVEMTCHLTSDCIINANAFPSEETCKETCMPLSGVRRCLAPPKAGYFHCSERNPALAVAPILMVFFDKTTGKCRWFTYYGCGGTANRFKSIAECEATCSDVVASKIFLAASDLCQIAPTVELKRHWPKHLLDSKLATKPISELQSPSRTVFDEISLTEATVVEAACENLGQMEYRWYLDVETGVCKQFAYSHCGGSANHFLARTDCEQFCAARKEDPSDICRQPPDKGQCSLNQTMWYFDPDMPNPNKEHGQGMCRPFTYTGCAGNSNRFTTLTACDSMCARFGRSVKSLDSREDPEESDGDRNSGLISENNTANLSTEYNSPSYASKNTDIVPEVVDHRLNGKADQKRGIDLLSIDLEPCRRPPQTGRCRPLNCSADKWENDQCARFNFQRWFFNAHTSNCEPFNYSGCGGSENTFDDAQSCHAACKARIVRPDRDQRCDSLPHQTKCYALSLSGTPGTEQKDHVIAFHFSVASATCKAFQLDISRPGCSMKPYFSNGHECLRACVKSTPTERHLQNRCFARKTHSAWNCSTGQEKTYRWSYLSELNQCVRFSQCESHINDSVQPGNNFATRAICETTCMATSLEEVCQLPMDPGPCRANQARYYYDIESAQCRIFLYGGCLGNANRFVSRQECQTACGEFAARVIMNSNVTGSGQRSEVGSSEVVAESEPQSIPVEVFDRMWRITQHHTDHFPWDLCLEGHSYGTCPALNVQHGSLVGHPHTQLTRYFYDRRLGKCQPFTYTGCGARGNHFDTIDTCKTVCEDRLRNPKGARCAATVELKQCPGSGVTGWAFNHSIGDCQFVELCPSPENAAQLQASVETLRLRRTNQWHGVWQAKNAALPTGVYATRSACQYHCLPKPPRGTDAQNVCHMNPIVTVPIGCNAMVTRWYFDPREATCRSYITCPQYGNNFPTEKVCQDTCTPTHPLQVCRQPLDLGGCSQFITRWYYDTRSRSCRPFFYGGCFGNSNRFLTKAECDSMCTVNDVCRQPVQKVSSDPTYPKRYYFDQTQQRCVPFHFTGILAHGNNFPSMAVCNATCLFVPDIEAIAMPQSPAQTTSDGSRAGSKPVADWSPTESDPTSGRADQSTDAIGPKHPVMGTHSSDNKTSLQSPCLTPLSTIGSNELEKQSICDTEDIIRELGYRFRAIDSPNTVNGQVEGICELTLVPICLSEPKMVFGGIVDSRMRTIGRVFQTQAECEKTCLSNRRIRRSAANGLEEDNAEEEQTERLVHALLENSGYDTDETSGSAQLRNGCLPEQAVAEQVDRFQHKFQVFTRWPCKFDDESSRSLVPLIERLSGKDVVLPCWILSTDTPTVRWFRLKDRKAYSIAPIRIPALNHIWLAHLHLPRVHPLRHNGAWSCEATSADGQRVVDELVQLHVIPRTFDKTHGHRSSNTSVEQVIHVPEGGTLFLACSFTMPDRESGYFYEEQIKWTRPNVAHTNVSTIVIPRRREIQFIHIHPVQASLHAGPWSCSNGRGDQINYFVEVGIAPAFRNNAVSPRPWSVSKHRRVQSLHCPSLTSWGNPPGKLTWLRCQRGEQACRPVSTGRADTETQLLVQPLPDDTYLCRVQNMWGRTQQRYVFGASRLFD